MINKFVSRAGEMLHNVLNKKVIDKKNYIYAYKSAFVGSLIYSIVVIASSTFSILGGTPSPYSESPVWDQFIGWYGGLAFYGLFLSPLWLITLIIVIWTKTRKEQVSRKNFYLNVLFLLILMSVITFVVAIVYFFLFMMIAVEGYRYGLEIHTI